MIGGIKERTTSSKSPAPPSANRLTGFPKAEHRSKKSAFIKSREYTSSAGPSQAAPPLGVQSKSTPESILVPQTGAGFENSLSQESVRTQISEENARAVESMTEDQRDAARQEILERFGVGIVESLRRAREARNSASEQEEKPINGIATAPSRSQTPTTPTKRLSSLKGDSRPSTPSSQKRIRFADVKHADVHVYESQPSSPKRQPLALLPPPDPLDNSIKPLPVRGSGPIIRMRAIDPVDNVDEDEGTPEDIRRRFFPSANPDEPSLQWITAPQSPELEEQSPETRFDLTGDPISVNLISSLPTHLGLHHHAGDGAGYTLSDILLLSRSTVPAQRAAMLEVASGILRSIKGGSSSKGEPLGKELLSRKEELRAKIVATGIQGLSAKGMTLIRAVEVVWEGIVDWEDTLLPIGITSSIELERSEPSKSNSAAEADASENFVLTLPLEHLIAHAVDHFSALDLPPPSSFKLLQIVHRLALQSRKYARRILTTPGIVPTLLSAFISGRTDEEKHLQPLAINVFDVLAQASRDSANTLVEMGVGDSLLRTIVVELPASNLTSTSVGNEKQLEMITASLRFYRTLAKYGLFTHLASIATEPFSVLGVYITSRIRQYTTPVFLDMTLSWLQLLDIWMICARNPHCTTPPHDIRWSQVIAWSWADDLSRIREALMEVVVPMQKKGRLYAALWDAISAWLEGSSVNSVRGGEAEKALFTDAALQGFAGDAEYDVVTTALKFITEGTSLSVGPSYDILESSDVLRASLRFLMSTQTSEQSNQSQPVRQIPLPIDQIHIACKEYVNQILSSGSELSTKYTFLDPRPLTSLLIADLRLSHKLKRIPASDWLLHALSVLSVLVPGDEFDGEWIITVIAGLLGPQFTTSLGWPIPEEVWKSGGLKIITPFLSHSLLPKYESPVDEEGIDTAVFIAPSVTTPHSITRSSQVTFPSISLLQTHDGTYGLPLPRDWVFSPVNDLLRSGTSKVFHILPNNWSFSETEVVRATLILAGIYNQIFGPSQRGFDHSHVVFACMRIYMLEHDQKQEDSAEEVFRDTFCNNAMLALLNSTRQRTSTNSTTSLELVARPFLGTTTPLYQMCTDFVALYDSISYSEPLFAALLIPPLSMGFAIDYRKLLWIDYVHLLRTIRTEPTHPAILDIQPYLWPIETNTQLINAYLGSLCRSGGLFGMLRTIALHHVACHIWVYLEKTDAAAASSEPAPVGSGAKPASVWDDQRAKHLFVRLTSQAPDDVIKDIVLYNRMQGVANVVQLSASSRSSRMAYVSQWANEPLLGRIHALLKA